MKNSKIFYILFLIIVITACSPFGRLYKEQSRVTLALPANRRSEPVEIAKRDSANQPPVLNFTFISAKGDSIPVGMSVEWDSIHKENLTTMALDEVVVSASSTRNTAERNGLINVEFVVTVPKVLQQENWMVNVRPVLMRGRRARLAERTPLHGTALPGVAGAGLPAIRPLCRENNSGFRQFLPHLRKLPFF
ncbi:hypothetical protein NXW55_19900 [Bacteroides fragilis]|nr:hypothetical protein NXW55_19900 [Bacteroides fragilis]